MLIASTLLEVLLFGRAFFFRLCCVRLVSFSGLRFTIELPYFFVNLVFRGVLTFFGISRLRLSRVALFVVGQDIKFAILEIIEVVFAFIFFLAEVLTL